MSWGILRFICGLLFNFGFGVSVLAQGMVHYVNLGGVQFPSAESGTIVGEHGNDNPVDFNQDGVIDIIVRTEPGRSQSVIPGDGNAVMALRSPPPDLSSYAITVNEGMGIGPIPIEGSEWVPARHSQNPSLGPIGPVLSAGVNSGQGPVFFGLFIEQTAYMGVEFQIDGQLHYGWMHLYEGFASANVYGYAYNTVPGDMILAGQVPEPSTWMMLFLGGGLLVLLRKINQRQQTSGV